MGDLILNLGVMTKRVSELKQQESRQIRKEYYKKKAMRKPEVFYNGSMKTLKLVEKFDHEALYWYLINHFDSDDYHKIKRYREKGIDIAKKRNCETAQIDVTYQINKIGRLTIPNGIYYCKNGNMKSFDMDNKDENKIKGFKFYRAVYGEYTEIENPIEKLKNGKLQFPDSVTYQMNMRNYMKGSICENIYYDVDIVGCQINILLQLFEYYKIPNNAIKNFMNKREDLMKDIGQSLGWSRSEVKGFIFKLLFNDFGNVKYQLNKEGIDLSLLPQELNSFIEETYSGRSELLEHYPDILAFAKTKKRENHKVWNIDGSALAYLLQTAEKNCLMNMYEFFTSKNVTVGALIHDGLHLEKTENIKELLVECQKYIYVKTAFRLQLLVKDFNKTEDNTVKRFDDLEGVNEIPGIEIEHINSRFLTSRDNDDNIDMAQKIMSGGSKVNLIKSYTGSGKTQMMKNLKTLNPGIDILSLVSRRSLSDKHTVDFKISHYRDVGFDEHSSNEVYQADSIDKIPLIEKDFIMILDEVASFCSHMLNNMHKMSCNRIGFVMRISELMNSNNCKLVIGADNNINIGTIKFIKSLWSSDKNIKLYINDHLPKSDTPVRFHHSIPKMKSEIVRAYNNGEQVFVCSNKNKRFTEKIVDPIIKNLSLKEGVDYIIYTGDRGPDRVDTDNWIDVPIIFASPAIVYGCDSNKKNVHIFGFYFNSQHFDAMDTIQQISRERSPLSVNLYMEDIRYKIYESTEQAMKETQVPNISIPLVSLEEFKFIRSYNAIRELYFYEQYRKSNHLNVRFYFLEQLKKKGFSNFLLDNVFSECPDGISGLTSEEHKILMDQLIVHDDKTRDKVAKRLTSLRFHDPAIPGKDEFNQRYHNLMVDVKTQNIITKDRNYEEYHHLKMWNGEYKEDDYIDIPELQLRKVKNKIQVLKQLHPLLFSDNIDENSDLVGHDDLIDKLNVTFRIRSNGELSKKISDLKGIYWIKKMSLLGDCVSRKTKRNRKGGKNERTYEYSMNDNLVNHYNALMNITKEYSNLKRQQSNNQKYIHKFV